MSRDRSSPSSPISSDDDRPNYTPCRHDVEILAADTLQQSIQSRLALAALGTTDTLVPVDRHDRPAKPSSRFLLETHAMADLSVAVVNPSDNSETVPPMKHG